MAAYAFDKRGLQVAKLAKQLSNMSLKDGITIPKVVRRVGCLCVMWLRPCLYVSLFVSLSLFVAVPVFLCVSVSCCVCVPVMVLRRLWPGCRSCVVVWDSHETLIVCGCR